MAGRFGPSPLSAGISSQTRIETHFSDASPSQSSWERLEGFFFENHHDDVISCLMGFCYPDPKISRDTLEDLFFQLKRLAAPGYKNHFTVEGNISSEKCFYRITDKKGDDIVSVYHGPIRVDDAKSSWDQVICLPGVSYNP